MRVRNKWEEHNNIASKIYFNERKRSIDTHGRRIHMYRESGFEFRQ
jgi:hypothetical protein